MRDITLQLSEEELELLDEMSRYNDVSGEWQSEEMETLGEKIRLAIEELE